MATIATLIPTSFIGVDPLLQTPAFGTGMQACDSGELHGEDFQMVQDSIIERRKKTAELSEFILASDQQDTFVYNTVPPLRSYLVDVALTRGSEILPVPFDLEEE